MPKKREFCRSFWFSDLWTLLKISVRFTISTYGPTQSTTKFVIDDLYLYIDQCDVGIHNVTLSISMIWLGYQYYNSKLCLDNVSYKYHIDHSEMHNVHSQYM